MNFRRLLGTSLGTAFLLGLAACGLATGGISPGDTGSVGSTGAGGRSAASSTGASSSSGEAGGGGGHGGAGGATSSSSGLGPEDCLNDMDDNGDGKVDCADDKCGGKVGCVDIPSGWTPVWAQKVADPSNPGTCPDGMPPQVYHTDPGGPASCMCQCALGGSAKCSAPEMTCWVYDSSCSGGLAFSVQPNDNGCNDVNNQILPNNFNNSGSCKITKDPKVLDNSCTASLNKSTPPMWGGAVLVCNTPSSSVDGANGGCTSGQRCVSADMPPNGPLCIKRDGSDPCPGGWTQASAGYADGTDNRDCGGCSCTVGCNGGGYVIHDDDSCKAIDPDISVNPNNCTKTPNMFDDKTGSYTATVATPTPMCNGSQPTGQVTTSGPVKICCKP